MADETPDPEITAYSTRLKPYASIAGPETDYLQLPLPERVENLGWQAAIDLSSAPTITCTICERAFDSQRGLANHLRQHHDKNGEGLVDEYGTIPGTETAVSSKEATTVGFAECTQQLDETEITYLIATATNDGDQTVKLRPYNGQSPNMSYALSIPTKYTEQGYLESVAAGDAVNYEIDTAAEELRIYRPDQFTEKLHTMY